MIMKEYQLKAIVTSERPLHAYNVEPLLIQCIFCSLLYVAIILLHFSAVILGWNNAMAVLVAAVATLLHVHYFTVL